MVDFTSFNFTAWYSSLPFPAQVGVGIAGVAIAVLAIILAIYIIKYTILLVYYILKGIYKTLVWAFKKLTDQPSSPAAMPTGQVEKSPFTQKTPANLAYRAPAVNAPAPVPAVPTPRFCAHCGARVDAQIIARIADGQVAFCSNCGSSFGPKAVFPSTQVV